MPTSPTGYPRAAAVSPRLQVRERTGSTNADLVAAAEADPAAWPHLSVLLTTDQTAGRGRLDRSWTTPAGSALAVSVLVRVERIAFAARGWIPLIAGASMARAIAAQLVGSGHTAGVKWPNDVQIDGQKVCGILAEILPGDPDAVVIGSGVNTTMAVVDLPVPTATSFAALGLSVDEDALLGDYLSDLDAQLTRLADARGDATASGLKSQIEGLCVTLGRTVEVSLPGGGILRGRAQRIDEDGRLVVSDGARETSVSAGDVLHVR